MVSFRGFPMTETIGVKKLQKKGEKKTKERRGIVRRLEQTKICVRRESDPGHTRGRRAFYH